MKNSVRWRLVFLTCSDSRRTGGVRIVFGYHDYTYTEFTVAAGAVTSPAPSSTLTSASTTLAWNAGTAGTTGC